MTKYTETPKDVYSEGNQVTVTAKLCTHFHFYLFHFIFYAHSLSLSLSLRIAFFLYSSFGILNSDFEFLNA
jgi:hypothetical protein